MKAGISKGLSFGFSSVNAGQRNSAQEPQVIAVSTEGGFRITPPVSAALGVAHGEYVMFISNVDAINYAIAQNDPEIVAFCEEQGLEVGSPEAAVAIHTEFDVWAIAKGIKEFDGKGNVRETSERLTINDKLTYVRQNYQTMLEQAMESDEEELKELLSSDVSDDEKMEALTPYVQARVVPKYKGSKTANPAALTGVGVSLNFTDTNIWRQLKADLGEEAKGVNRVYDIDLDSLTKVSINNGFKEVEVAILPLGDYTDKEPSRIGGDKDDE